MISDISKTFGKKHILVIGDVVLDNYVYGDVDRINPEAPVPVLHVAREEYKLGGTANVAANITSLGGRCTLIGQIGKDDFGGKIIALADKAGIKSYLIERNDFTTIVKKRIIARNQQVIRVDYEDPKPLGDTHIKEIINYIKTIKYDLVVISDYAKGVVCKNLMDFIKTTGVKVIVDPKPAHREMYKGVYMITPNLRESFEMCDEKELIKRGETLADLFACNVVITRGEDGASLFNQDKRHYYIPAKKREVFDVVGAGDTFVAAISLGVSSGMDLPMACSFANIASGLVVEKVGTSVVTIAELLDSIGETNGKLKDVNELKIILESLKNKGNKVVFTNGCFDILHVGHTKLLKEAKALGDVLVLGLNTDDSVRALKGSGRPINNENDRAEILSHIPYVDYIVFFSDSTPCKLISELKPDIHVKGGDYNPNDYAKLPEARVVDSYGGKIVVVKYVDGKSTTNTIDTLKKIKSLDL